MKNPFLEARRMGNDFLKQAAKAAPAKKGSKAEVPEYPHEMVEADQLKAVKAQLNDLEAQEKILSAKIYDPVGAFARDLSKKGKHSASIRVRGPKGAQLLVSWKHAYSKVGMDQEETLEKLIGKERWDRFMGRVVEIVFKYPDSPQLLNELLTTLGRAAKPEEKDPEKLVVAGQESFFKLFDVKMHLAPKPEYTEKRFVELPDETNKALSDLVKQYSASAKVEA